MHSSRIKHIANVDKTNVHKKSFHEPLLFLFLPTEVKTPHWLRPMFF